MNTYPYIGEGTESRSIVLFYEQNKGVTLESKTWASFHLQYSDGINEDLFKNITREYLVNTYGKVESKEHAEFIVKLAVSAGFEAGYIECQDGWFCFTEKYLYFYPIESRASDLKEKLITIPLPPKESEEWPLVGDEVLTASKQKADVIAVDSNEAWIKYKDTAIGSGYASVAIATLSKPPTPEEELSAEILKFLESGKTYDRLAKAIINGEIKGLSYKPE